jgi:hypothetical protein
MCAGGVVSVPRPGLRFCLLHKKSTATSDIDAQSVPMRCALLQSVCESGRTARPSFHTTCTHAPSMHCHDANHRSVAPQRAERGAAAAWGEAPTWVRSIACTWTQLRRAIDGLHARQLVSARRTDARRGQPSLGGRTTGLISLEVSCRSNAASSTTTSRRERAASSDDGRRRGDPTAVHP